MRRSLDLQLSSQTDGPQSLPAPARQDRWESIGRACARRWGFARDVGCLGRVVRKKVARLPPRASPVGPTGAPRYRPAPCQVLLCNHMHTTSLQGFQRGVILLCLSGPLKSPYSGCKRRLTAEERGQEWSGHNDSLGLDAASRLTSKTRLNDTITKAEKPLFFSTTRGHSGQSCSLNCRISNKWTVDTGARGAGGRQTVGGALPWFTP